MTLENSTTGFHSTMHRWLLRWLTNGTTGFHNTMHHWLLWWL